MKTNTIDWLKAAYFVHLSRRLDRLEVERLTPQGKVKYQFSSGGHELAQVLLALALNHPHDAATVYYRSRPFMLASGLSLVDALAAGMARGGGISDGRDVGVVYNLPGRGQTTVLPASGDVGAQYTPAAGWAQAIQYRLNVLSYKDWQGAISVALGGDGSVATNGFWAALNIATTHKLPMLFFIEDNNYGLSVPASLQTPGGDISANLASFGNLEIIKSDGTDPKAAWNAIQQAVKYVRSGTGPCLLHIQVVRLEGHTFIDDQAYKSAEIRAKESERDPKQRLHEFLQNQGLSDTQWQALEKQVEEELESALQTAENRLEAAPDSVVRHLFYGDSPPQQGGLRPEGVLPAFGQTTPNPSGPRINFVDAVRRTLELEMKINKRILVFGEDVGVKGGVHGATLDMQAHFGSQRVFDTSLSEDGIIGRSVGLAIAGLLPVPEIQFRKYADPAHEQISDLGTLRWRTANKFAAPLVVRIPVGFGKKTGDPWHSVSGEAIFAHTLGWRIAFPSNAEDAVGLLRSALRGDDPTLFLEHRALLDSSEGRRPYPGDDYCLPFGRAAHLTEGDELCLITWGAMTARCLQAAEHFAGRVCTIDLRTIVPWDQETVLEEVQKCGKVLIVHEDTYTAGFAGEIIATIAGQAFTYLDAPIERLTTPDVPIPYNQGMMDFVLPSVDRIQNKIEEILDF